MSLARVSAVASCLVLSVACAPAAPPPTTTQPEPAAPAPAPRPRPDASVAPPVVDARAVPADTTVDLPADAPPDTASVDASMDGSVGGDVRAGVDARALDLPAATPCAHPLCLDFERGALDEPWRTRMDGGKVAVDETRARSGRFALRVTLPKHDGKGGDKAFIYRDLPPALRGPVIHGRYHLFVKGAPEAGVPDGHGSLVELEGTQTTGAAGMYGFGVQWQRFMGNFVQPSPFVEYATECRKEDTRCTAADATRTLIPTDRWTCVEWTFDGKAGLRTTVKVDGETLVFNPYGKPTWPTMTEFQRIKLGVLQFWWHPAVDVWIDDVVMDTKPIGCGG